MKTKRLNTLARNLFLGILTTMMILPFTSSAKKIPFLPSTIAPAARGYVKVKKDKNKNYVIQVHISYLAEITRIQPTKQTYLVWMVTDRDITKNIGRVKSSKNASNNLTGYFETVSSFQPTKIFITAEVDESVQEPCEQVVLTTDRFWE
jgi:tRNA (Thr-GGU) A37 N-methylase